jgi:hypothetical protein
MVIGEEGRPQGYVELKRPIRQAGIKFDQSGVLTVSGLTLLLRIYQWYVNKSIWTGLS